MCRGSSGARSYGGGRYQAQKGAVLIISLVLLALLIILSVIGQRAVVNSTRQSGNFGDRQMAFQAAELALEKGIQFVGTLSGVAMDERGTVLNCMETENRCLAEPASGGVVDASLSATSAVTWRVANIEAGELPAAMVGNPQYFVERMHELSSTGSAAASRDSSSFSYGQEVSGSVRYVFYRVTSRNFDPTSDTAAGRAFVQLQAVVRRPF